MFFSNVRLFESRRPLESILPSNEFLDLARTDLRVCYTPHEYCLLVLST